MLTLEKKKRERKEKSYKFVRKNRKEREKEKGIQEAGKWKWVCKSEGIGRYV